MAKAGKAEKLAYDRRAPWSVRRKHGIQKTLVFKTAADLIHFSLAISQKFQAIYELSTDWQDENFRTIRSSALNAAIVKP